ncbi:hypothetical protein L4X63_19375 [Geomonas sp. Red32]|uniref:hypothetical protein n=1 Tax=Geomonas sp. Red32 TaxID=2912856 RepID=UPI00202CDF2C|nr:hypothetical protein [Geomonas sp. Red32]MCM0083754.1 hypothetical protein [Geomonas sp. Red32]
MKMIRLILVLGAFLALAGCGGGGGGGGGTPAAPTTASVNVALAASGVRGVQGVISLPAGVTLTADSSGKVPDSTFTTTISGLNATGYYTAASGNTPAKLSILITRPTADLPTGDLVKVTFDLASGTAVPAATDYVMSNSALSDQNGASVSGSLSLD